MKKKDYEEKLLQKHKSFLKNAVEKQTFSSFITSEFKKDLDLIDIRKKKKAKSEKV